MKLEELISIHMIVLRIFSQICPGWIQDGANIGRGGAKGLLLQIGRLQQPNI